MSDLPITLIPAIDKEKAGIHADGARLIAGDARRYDDEASQRYAEYAEGVAAALDWLAGRGCADKLIAVLDDGETLLRFSETTKEV